VLAGDGALGAGGAAQWGAAGAELLVEDDACAGGQRKWRPGELRRGELGPHSETLKPERAERWPGTYPRPRAEAEEDAAGNKPPAQFL
jgi:hypothetical protein